MTDNASSEVRKTAQDFFKSSTDLEVMIAAAKKHAATDSEKQFISDLEDRLSQYGNKTIISEKQVKFLRSLASTRVGDHFETAEKYQALLEAAQKMAATDFAKKFTAEQIEAYGKYGMKALLSEKQKQMLCDIADGKVHEKAVQHTW